MNASHEALTSRARRLVADAIYPEGRERRDRLEREADTDSLTGLANRRALDRALPAAEAEPLISVVILDLDNFGEFNKRASHERGDEELRRAAQVICEAAGVFGCDERVFRRGGDEFVVLCRVDHAAPVRDAVERRFGMTRAGDLCVTLTGTIGTTFGEADAKLQQRKRKTKQLTSACATDSDDVLVLRIGGD